MKRRTLVRIGLVLVAMLVVVAIGLFIVKGRWEESLRRDLEARASDFIGGRVTIERLRITVLPPAAWLETVRCLKVGNRGSRAEGSIPSIDLNAGLWDLIRGGEQPLRMTLHQPNVRLFLAEGREWFPTSGQIAGWFARTSRAVVGSSITIANGRIDYAWEAGAKGSISRIRLELSRAEAKEGLNGRLEFGGGKLETTGGSWSDLRGDTSFGLDAGGLRFDPLSVRGEGLAIVGALRLDPREDRLVEGSLQIGIDATRLASYLPDSAGFSGRLEANLTGGWHDGTIAAQGGLSAIGLKVWGLQIDSMECDVTIDERLKARRIRAHVLGGQATGSFDATPEKVGFRSEADVRLDGVDLNELASLAGWAGPDLSGTVHYRGRHTFDSSGIDSLRGSGVLDAIGHYRLAEGSSQPMEVTARLETRGDVVRLSGGTIRAGGVRGTFTGRVKRGEGVRLRLDRAGENRESILPLFRVRSDP